jgi:hypothetical protein
MSLMRLRGLAPAFALVVTGLLVAGCGSGSGSDVTLKAQKALEPYVQAVRQAAADKDYPALKRAVRALKHEVTVEQDGISASRQADIDDAADAVLTAASPSPSASPSDSPTQTQSPSQTPTTPPATVTITPTHTVTAPASTPPPTPSDSISIGTSGDGDGSGDGGSGGDGGGGGQ